MIESLSIYIKSDSEESYKKILNSFLTLHPKEELKILNYSNKYDFSTFPQYNIRTKYFLYVENVEITRPILPIINYISKYNLVVFGKVEKIINGITIVPRINPSFIFMDMDIVNKCNIPFYDLEKRVDKAKLPYYVGSSFLETVQKKEFKFENFIGIQKYILEIV